MRALTATTIIVLITATSTAISQQVDYHKYAVLIDAGSSGTRLWVYKWQPVIRSLPQINYILRKKSNPGISEVAKSSDELRKELKKMLDQAAEKIPTSKQASTPVYLLATAGMRYYLEEDATRVYEIVHELLSNPSISPFLYSRNNIRILSGEEEGVFAWIAVNYMMGTFNSNSQEPAYKKTYGVMEMGGASTQIAFVPKGFILAKLFPITIAGEKYSLYSHSYLQMGQDSVERWIVEHLAEVAGSNPSDIVSPCFNKGFDCTEGNINCVGDSSHENKKQCYEMLKELVVKVPPRYCHPKPCGVGTVYQPTIDPEQRFYTLSVYPLIFQELGLTTKEHTGPVTINQLLNASLAYCDKSIDELKMGADAKRHKHLHKPCYMGLYLSRLLHYGYGFPKDTKSIYALDKVNDNHVDWTLGALLYEMQSASNIDNCPATFATSDSRRAITPFFFTFFIVVTLPLLKLSFLPGAMH